MLKIRLQKIGKKNSPSYRVVLVEHTTSPQGEFIELLGTYNPRLKRKSFNKGRIEYWLSQGVQPSPTVHNLLVDEKIIEREKLMAWKAKRKKKEAAAAQASADTQVGQPSSEGAGGEVPKVEEASKPEEPKPEEPKAEEPKPAEETQPIDTETKKE